MLDTDFCFGLVVDMVGLFPWQDRKRQGREDTGAGYHTKTQFCYAPVSHAWVPAMFSFQSCWGAWFLLTTERSNFSSKVGYELIITFCTSEINVRIISANLAQENKWDHAQSILVIYKWSEHLRWQGSWRELSFQETKWKGSKGSEQRFYKMAGSKLWDGIF